MNRDLLSSAIIAVAFLLVFVLVLPQWNELGTARDALAEREELVKQRQEQLKNLTELVQQYNTQRAAIGNLNLLVPEKKQLDQIIVGLQAAAQSSGLQTSELTIGGSDNQSDRQFKTVALRLGLSGTYGSLLNFLKTVEQSLRIYDVTEINIGKSTSGAGFTLEVKLNAYSKK